MSKVLGSDTPWGYNATMTPRAKVQLLSMPTTTALPLLAVPKIHLSRNQRHDALAERLLGAAEIGAEGLVKLIEEGAIKGRDLAVTIGILIDKVAMLEKRQEPPTANVAELLQKMQRLTELQAELESRGLSLQA